jgi:hypothetical protein
MSRPTYRQTAGAVLAALALVLGMTAAAAIGWSGKQGKDHGGKTDTGSKTETTGKTDTGKKETETTPPQTVTIPPATVTVPPTTVTTPATPPSTVTTTSETPPTVTTQERPPSRTTPPTKTTPPSETTPPTETTTTAPPIKQVAKRKKLAATGLSPVLMVLFGVGLLGGGGFLLRRSLLQR